MTRSIAVYVEDILTEMDHAEAFAKGMTLADIVSDPKTTYAPVRAFEIMGEAAKHVPAHVRARAPGVRWRGMTGLRDRLAHSYWGVDLAFALAAIHERFPVERPILQRLLDHLTIEDEAALNG